MGDLSCGILYWKHPVKQKLEFILAKKIGKGDYYSLFYHENIAYASKFYGDLLGLVGPFEDFNNIITQMRSPHHKTFITKYNYTVYYIYINYNPQLIISLNGFKNYLDQCTLNLGIKTNCSKYPYSVYIDYFVFDSDQIKNMIINDEVTFRDKLALTDFDGIVKTLENNLQLNVASIPNEVKGAQVIMADLMKNKETINMGNNDPIFITQLRQEHENYYNQLKPKYKAAITYYTGQGYSLINDYLRGVSSPSPIQAASLQQHIKNINQVLNNAPPTTKSMIVYRGLNLDTLTKFHNLKAGQVIDLFTDSFNSTSFKIGVASGDNFAGQICCVFILYLPPGIKGLYIGKKSQVSYEDEFILAPGPLFKIMKFKHENLPLKGFYPAKPELRFYRAYCVDCEQAYQKYNNVVYYQLAGPGFAVSKTPKAGEIISPIYLPIDVAGKIVPKKVQYVKTYDVTNEGKLFMTTSQFVQNPPEIPTELIKTQLVPNIDAVYLQGLSLNVIQTLGTWTSGCPHNYFRDPSTSQCVLISSSLGQTAVQNLIAQMNKPISPEQLKTLSDHIDSNILRILQLSQEDEYLLQLLIINQPIKNEYISGGYQPIQKNFSTLDGVNTFIKFVLAVYKGIGIIVPSVTNISVEKYRSHTRNYLLYMQTSDNNMYDIANNTLIPTDDYLIKYHKILEKLDSIVPSSSKIYQIFDIYDQWKNYSKTAQYEPNYIFIYYSFLNNWGLLGLQLLRVFNKAANYHTNSLKYRNLKIYDPFLNTVASGNPSLSNFDHLVKRISEVIYNDQPFTGSNLVIDPSLIKALRLSKHKINAMHLLSISQTPTPVDQIVLLNKNFIIKIEPFNHLDYQVIDEIVNELKIKGIINYNKIYELHLTCLNESIKRNLIKSPKTGKCVVANSLTGKIIIKDLIKVVSTQPNIPQPNIPQPNIPQPNIPQPNIPQPNIPQPNIPQPNIPQPKIPQPKIPQPKILQPKIPQPNIPQPNIPQPNIPQPNIPQPKIPQPKIPQGVTTILNIEPQHLENIPAEIVQKIILLAQGCEKNKFKSPKTGQCIAIKSQTGQKIIQEMIKKLELETQPKVIQQPISIPNIEQQYIVDLNHQVATKISELAQGCEKNKFRNPVTNKCVFINGAIGKKILAELNKQYLQKSSTGTPPKSSIPEINMNIDKKYLELIPPHILPLIAELNKGCEKNKLKSPKSGQCIAITSPTGQKIIQELLDKTTIPSIPPTVPLIPEVMIPNIDEIHWKNLPIQLKIKLAELAKGCEKNKFRSPKTNQCIAITSKTGQKIIEELITTDTSKVIQPTQPKIKFTHSILIPPNLNIKYFDQIPPIVAEEVAKLGKDCDKDQIHHDRTGNCVLIYSNHGIDVINRIAKIKQLDPIFSHKFTGINEKYIEGYNFSDKQKIIAMNKGCNANQIFDEGTGECLLITSQKAQQIIKSKLKSK